MTNLKKLVLTTLATTATIIGGGAQAYEVHDGIGYYTPDDFTGPHAEIVDSLYDLEVPVVDGSTVEGVCEADPGYILYGFYVPSENVMVLCKDGLTQNEIEETLVHEAVHVYQDYRAGLHNSELEVPDVRSLFEQLPQGYQQNILHTYDQEDWELETEAWFFQDKPEAVAEAFRF